jgi:hypothetical protein
MLTTIALSRSWDRALTTTVLAWLSLGAASAAAAPPAVVAAAKAQCRHASLRSVGVTWLADCADGAEGERSHALSAIAADGKVTLLGDYYSHSGAPSQGFDVEGSMHIDVAQVAIEQPGTLGGTQRTVWDLGVAPPRKLRLVTGGALIHYEERCGTELTSPRCTADLVALTIACTEKLPVCPTNAPDPNGDCSDDILTPGATLQFTPVPRAPASVSDPWRCGVSVDRPYFGKNAGHSRFDVVATEPSLDRALLRLRAHDTTPQPTSTRGDWQRHDHYEIWLSDRGTITEAQLQDQAGWCAAKARVAQLIVAPHADGTVELDMGRAADRPLLADVAAEAKGDELVLTFRKGSLRDWLVDGAVTVAYSDSRDGKRQDTLIGTSRVRFNRAETFGHLLPSLLCPDGP